MSAPNTPSRPIDGKATSLRKMSSVGTLPTLDQLGLSDKAKSLKRSGSIDANDPPYRNKLGFTRSNSAENAAQAARGSLESFDLSILTNQLTQSSSSILSPRSRTVTLGGAEPKPIVKITTKSNTSAYSVIDERTDPYLDVGGFLGMSPSSYANKPIKKKEKEDKETLPSSMLVLNAIIEGMLLFKKKEKGKWKRRWVVMDPNNLFVFKSAEHQGAPIQIALNLSHPKPPTNKKKAKTQFILQTPTRSYKFQAANETELKEWMKEIRDVCDSLTLQSIGKNEIQSSVNSKEELKKLLEIPGNNVCADCSSPNPEWSSINLGVFICIECSGIHRNLGTHISKVRSLTLDSWDNEMVRVMKLIGNTKANAVWEASVPESFKKPSPKDPIGKKGEWIQEKYELGLFKKTQSTEPQKQEPEPEVFEIPEPPHIPELPPTPQDEDEDDEPLPPLPQTSPVSNSPSPSSPKTLSPVSSTESVPKVAPKPPPKPTSTPEDWRTAVAPDGRKYYYNVKTKERTWNIPEALQKVVVNVNDLPPGWKEAKTSAGKVYYYNKTTKQTVWTRPTQ